MARLAKSWLCARAHIRVEKRRLARPINLFSKIFQIFENFLGQIP